MEKPAVINPQLKNLRATILLYVQQCATGNHPDAVAFFELLSLLPENMAARILSQVRAVLRTQRNIQTYGRRMTRATLPRRVLRLDETLAAAESFTRMEKLR